MKAGGYQAAYVVINLSLPLKYSLLLEAKTTQIAERVFTRACQLTEDQSVKRYTQ